MNFGRGDVIKEEELLRALKEESIAYAVLDVFEKEPLPGRASILEDEQCHRISHMFPVILRNML